MNSMTRRIPKSEETVVDQITAARTIAELEAEIEIRRNLETLARRSGTDKKRKELFLLLQNQAEMLNAHGHRRKLVLFSEHRDTLNISWRNLSTFLGISFILRHKRNNR